MRAITRRRCELVLVLLSLLVMGHVHADVGLVKNGKPLADIVVATNALSIVKLAAQDLQKYLESMSGVRLVITNAPSTDVGNHVYVGESEYTTALGFKRGEFKNSGFRIVAKDSYVILAGIDIQRTQSPFSSQGEGLKKWQEFCGEKFGFGRGGEGKGSYNAPLKLFTNDDAGTWYAVAHLLEQLGVRFYAPYENGTVIPERKTIAVAGQDLRKEAAFARREFCYYGDMRDDADGIAWFKRLKLGNHNIIINNHTSDDVFCSKEQKTLHPEYLACDADGKPYSGYPDGHGLPRFSDPGFRKASVIYMNRMFEAIPDLQTMTVGAPDGGIKMDARDVAHYGKPTASVTQQASQYLWDFHVYLCKELKKTHPGKCLLYFDAGGANEIPENIEDFPDNLIVPYCWCSANMVLKATARAKMDDCKRWQARMKTVTPGPLWDFFLFYRTPAFPRYPVVFTESLQREMQAIQPFVDGKFIEIQPGERRVEGEKKPRSGLGVPGLMHLMVYWQSRLFWEPETDRKAILDEYYRLFFGPAKAEMKEFHEFAEEVWSRQESRSVTRTTGFLKKPDVDRYFDILQRARVKAGHGSVFDQRIALIEEEMQPLKKQFAAFTRTGPQIHAFTPSSWGISAEANGDLNSPFWRSAHWNWYALRDVVTGEGPSKNGTSVSFRMAVNKALLHIGIVCSESRMDHLVAKTERQDDQAITNDDTVEVYIATPERSYFRIVVNPRGAILDESTDVTIVDRDTLPILWNPGTKAVVRKYSDRWTVELAVPTKDFGALGPSKIYPWGINVCRTRRAGGHPELFAVAPTGEPRFSDISKMGDLALGDEYKERLSDPAVPQGFTADFQSAKALFDKKEYSQALEAFNPLAVAAPTPESKAGCLSYAALCLSQLTQYEAALALAKTIELKPASVNCQMTIMLEHKKQKELIEAFKDEDIAAWPDGFNYQGFRSRGAAYRALGNNPAAAVDWAKAVEQAATDERTQCYLASDLGALYLTLKDDDNALIAYLRVQAFPAFKSLYVYPDATLAIAGILIRQGKLEEARAELHKPPLDNASGIWKVRTLEMQGNVERAQGKKEAALARYKVALNVEGIPKSYTDALNEKIAELSKP